MCAKANLHLTQAHVGEKSQTDPHLCSICRKPISLKSHLLHLESMAGERGLLRHTWLSARKDNLNVLSEREAWAVRGVWQKQKNPVKRACVFKLYLDSL